MDPVRYHCIFTALIFIIIGCRCSSSSSSSHDQINDDVLGLIQFKASLADPTNALRSWSQSTDESPCYWTGITCDEVNGRVIAIELQELSLSGHNIGYGLDKLIYLQTLSLANNNLSGTIPLEITQLAQMRKLDLSNNKLSDSIVSSLGNLRILDLSGNYLTGIIPNDLFSNSCKALHYLSLAGNRLDGSIPDSIASCYNLRFLNLSSNLLITNNYNMNLPLILPQLSVLDLSYNSFSGRLPTLLPSLITIKLQGNRFSGAISPQIGDCVMLQLLDLSHNMVSGSFPDSMQALKSLSFLNLAHNLISGTIPPWLGSLSSLKLLNLTSNRITGQPPSTLGLLKELTVMDISYNLLTGEIPSSLSGCDRLKLMDLSFNRLQGNLPEILPPNLISMRVSNNSLTGGLPLGFYSQCQLLKTLDLSRNSLSGPPPSLVSCAKMEYLNIAYNSFSGNLPEFPAGGSSIISLDMSHNQLSGSIPLTVGEANSLTSLLLDGNKLNGSIPHQLGNCSSLTNINFSQNNLCGSIPGEIGSLSNLEVLDLSYNQFSGSLPSELGKLQKLAELNLSYNQLEGPIPDYGALLRFDRSAFLGNAHLCGSNVNVTCFTTAPKPLVLDPNSTTGFSMDSNSLHNHKKLSISAVLAICAAVAISLGVILILVLNSYAAAAGRNSHYAEAAAAAAYGPPPPPPSADTFDISTKSPSLELPIGKLVMFSKSSDPRTEDWVSSAHALLNKETEMGRGGLGASYKAVLGDGRTVVVKKLTVSSLVKSQHDFEKEVQYLGKVKHKNVLKLQGYYWTPQLQLLIYDFMPNGNLYRKLHENSNSNSSNEEADQDLEEADPAPALLSWSIRFKIALGIAKGMAHLHGCDPPIIHYNLKSSNILLDHRFNPKISDCGLANLLPVPDRYMMSIKSQNALGYMAPEFASPDVRMNDKCDVYGYGILLLELITGRLPLAYVGDDTLLLCDYVRSWVEKGKPIMCVDPKLMKQYTESQVLPIIKLGLICSSHVPNNRPSMLEVVQILELIKTSGSNSKFK